MPGRFVALTLLICTLWASLGIVIKLCLADAPPLGLAAVRMALSSVVLWPWLQARWPAGLDGTAWRAMLIAALCFSLLLGLTHLGFAYVPASRGVVLLNTTPLFVAVLAHYFVPREPLSLAKGTGLAVAFAGVVVIFARRLDGGATALGDALMVLAAISWAFHTLWTKRAAEHADPATLTLVQFVGATVLLGVMSVASESVALWRPTANLAAGIAYLAVVGTVIAWLLWVHVLRNVPARAASAFMFTVPLIGVVLSAIVLGEAITLQFALGACLVSAGIIAVNWRGRSRQVARTDPRW